MTPGTQSTITDALRNYTDQRIDWLLSGVYTVLNGKDRGRAYIRSLKGEVETLEGWVGEE